MKINICIRALFLPNQLMHSEQECIFFLFIMSLCGSQSKFIFSVSLTCLGIVHHQDYLLHRASVPNEDSKLTDKSNIIECNLPLAVNGKINHPVCLSCDWSVVSIALFSNTSPIIKKL